MKKWFDYRGVTVTGIHGDDGDFITRLGFAIERAEQRNFAGSAVNAEETLVAVFDEVADLVVR